LAKLGNVQASVAGGNTTAACNQLSSFINEVSAQTGNIIMVDQANQLIHIAKQVVATWGCS
jgi:hypothetical protein